MNQRLQRLQARMSWSYMIVVSIVMSVLILALGFTSVQPKKYNFQLNHVAELTIRAPKTLEDVEQTNENKQHAKEKVADVYLYQSTLKDQQLALLDTYMSFLKTLRKAPVKVADLQKMAETANWDETKRNNLTKNRTAQQALHWAQLTAEERHLVYQSALRQLEDEASAKIYSAEVVKQASILRSMAESWTNSAVSPWLQYEDAPFLELQTYVTTLLSDALSNEIQPNGLLEAIAQIKAQIRSNNAYLQLQSNLTDFLQPFVIPTVAYNEDETNRQKEEAALAVQPSYILQGQVIVQEGHLIDAKALRQLKLFGYVDASAQRLNANAFYALVVFHCLFMLALHTEGFRFKQTNRTENKMHLTVYAVVFVSLFALLKGLELVQSSGVVYATLILPISLFPLMVVPKSSMRNGIFGLIFFNVMALFVLSDIFNLVESMTPILFYCISGLIALAVVAMVQELKPSWQLFGALVAIFVMTFIPLAIGLNIDLLSADGMRTASFMVANIMVTFVLFALLSPYWEQLVDDRADLTLNALANLNHPLLKQLIEQAPGTYHHSMMVANLSSNAVEVIGGDSLLTRVASYYHDVGKTEHPLFFVENLPAGMENPHLVMQPQESTKIITDHVRLGAELLEQYRMPQSILDICWQHHGTTLVKYFYYQAKKENPSVDEATFRYDGPRPQTKEAAIIMIADSVEAASRTLKDYSQATIEDLVEKIIADKNQDNQFADCDLTVQELKLVKRSLVVGIASMYHTRVEYPKE